MNFEKKKVKVESIGKRQQEFKAAIIVCISFYLLITIEQCIRVIAFTQEGLNLV